MPIVETQTRRIIKRLEAEGWRNIGGGSHDRFVREDRPYDVVVVPRHRQISPGTARSIAKLAGWI